MKLFLSLIVLSVAVTASCEGVAKASSAEGPFDFIYSRHIEGVGLVLIGRDGETRRDQGLASDLLGLPLSYLDKQVGQYFHPRLRLAEDDGSIDRFVLVARLQDSLDVATTEPLPASYQWISDDQIGDFWQVDSALIFDAYFPGIGELFRYTADGYSFHIRAGASWDRSTELGGEVDQREFFLGASARPFVWESAGRSQSSPMDFGFLYQEDAIADAHQWSLTLNLHPIFPLIKDKPFVIGEKMTWKELFSQVEPEKPKVERGGSNLEKRENENLDTYFYIKPNFTLNTLIDDASKDGSIEFEDYAMNYGARFGISLYKQKLELSYSVTGVSPVGDISDNHLFQELRLQFQPWKDRPLFATAKYTYGERAPSFVKEDRITLSLGVRF